MSRTKNSASKKEIEQFLKENNLTRDDMQRMYDECIPINFKVRALSQKYKWYELPMSLIVQLPGCKEATLESIKQEEEKKANELALKKQQEEERKYYEENFERLMYEKIVNGEELTERETLRLIFEYEVSDGPTSTPDRWTTPWRTVVELCDHRFSIDWNKANTEMQEHNVMYCKFMPCDDNA